MVGILLLTAIVIGVFDYIFKTSWCWYISYSY